MDSDVVVYFNGFLSGGIWNEMFDGVYFFYVVYDVDKWVERRRWFELMVWMGVSNEIDVFYKMNIYL